LANTSRLTAARSVAGEHLHGPRLPAIQRRPTSSARGTREQLPDPRCCLLAMAAPLVAGLAVAAAALAGRYSIQAWHAYKARPIVPRMRKFYEGGFQPTMTRREAALILGKLSVQRRSKRHTRGSWLQIIRMQVEAITLLQRLMRRRIYWQGKQKEVAQPFDWIMNNVFFHGKDNFVPPDSH
ncbi:unnamed protein product, partial [Urochloa humidicola]